MTLTVRQLAEKVRGELAGDGELPISNARTLAEARLGDITFVDAERHLPAWHNCQASAAIVPLGTAVNGRPVIRVKDPLAAFAAVVLHFRDFRPSADTGQVAPSASIHPTATLGAGTTVGPFAVIGEGAVVGARCHVHSGVSVGRFCKIGDDTTLYPHVILYDDCVLGNRVIVHANAVLGADGFGYRTQAGKHVKVPQLGNVEVEDDVEIGACTTIDRGTFGPTRIGTGTKIDNLVQIGHNCQIGRHNLLCSQVGVAGSCTTGDYVVMAGQVGIADHVTVADKAMIGAKAGVVKDVAEGSRLLGYPARPDKESLRIFLTLDKLPDLIKDMKKVKHSLGMGEGE